MKRRTPLELEFENTAKALVNCIQDRDKEHEEKDIGPLLLSGIILKELGGVSRVSRY